MTEHVESEGLRIVALLVIVSVASVAVLWTLEATSSASQSVFAVFLAVDLVSFAMISYVYRESKSGDRIGRVPLLAGSIFLVLLIAAGLVAAA